MGVLAVDLSAAPRELYRPMAGSSAPAGSAASVSGTRRATSRWLVRLSAGR